MGKKQTEKYIKEYSARLQTGLNAYKIILYGSFVNGTYRPGESDIDMLVISQDFTDMDDNDRLDFLYKKTVGLPLDWHIYGFTPDEIQKVSSLNTLFEALKTGKQFT